MITRQMTLFAVSWVDAPPWTQHSAPRNPRWPIFPFPPHLNHPIPSPPRITPHPIRSSPPRPVPVVRQGPDRPRQMPPRLSAPGHTTNVLPPLTHRRNSLPCVTSLVHPLSAHILPPTHTSRLHGRCPHGSWRPGRAGHPPRPPQTRDHPSDHNGAVGRFYDEFWV